MLRKSLGSIALSALLVLPLAAQESSPATEPAPAEAVPMPDLFTEFDNVVRVEHGASAIAAILADPDLELFLRAASGGEVSIASLLTEFENGISELPRGVTFGTDSAFLRTLGVGWKMLFQVNLLAAAIDEGGAPVEAISAAAREKLLGEMIEALRTIPRGHLSAVVELGEGEDPSEFFEMFELIENFAPGAVERGENSRRIDIGLIARSQGIHMIVGAVISMWGATPEHQESLREWAESLEGEFRISGAPGWGRLDLRLGPDRGTPKVRDAVRQFAAQVDAGKSEVRFRFDLTPLAEGFRAAEVMWKEWKDTPLGIRALEQDVAGVFSDFKFILEQIENVGSISAGHLDLGRRTEFRVRAMVKKAPGVDLRTSSLARCVPSDASFWVLDGTSSFASAFYTNLIDAEGRMEVRSLANLALEGQLEEYYELFQSAREIVVAAAESMPPGYGWIFDAPKPHAVRIAVGDEGAQNGLIARGMPVPGFALLVRSDDFTRDRARFERLVEQIARATVGEDEAPAPVLTAEELGLGVPTMRFSLRALAKRLGLDVQATVDGDWVAHVCALDGVVFFSTSPDLSRRIIASSKKESGSVVKGSGHVTRAWNDPFPWLESNVVAAEQWIGSEGALRGLDRGEVEALPDSIAERIGEGLSHAKTLLSRIRLTRGSEQISDNVRDLHCVLTVAPTNTKIAVEDLDPAQQRRRARLAGFRYLRGQQQADGRWSDGESGALSDLGLTGLCLYAFQDAPGMVETDPELRAARDRAITWVLAQQQWGGTHRGQFGSSASASARLDQAIAIESLFGFPSTADRAQRALLPTIEALTRFPGTSPLSLEEAYWWDNALMCLLDPVLEEEELAYDEIEDMIFDKSDATEAIAAALPASEQGRALALSILGYELEEEDLRAAIAADCARFGAEKFKTARTSFHPLEQWARASLSEDADLPWQRAWIRALATGQRPPGEPDAGSWPPLAAPYDTPQAATAMVLLILGELSAESTDW